MTGYSHSETPVRHPYPRPTDPPPNLYSYAEIHLTDIAVRSPHPHSPSPDNTRTEHTFYITGDNVACHSLATKPRSLFRTSSNLSEPIRREREGELISLCFFLHVSLHLIFLLLFTFSSFLFFPFIFLFPFFYFSVSFFFSLSSSSLFSFSLFLFLLFFYLSPHPASFHTSR